jgi:hypothetical protein
VPQGGTSKEIELFHRDKAVTIRAIESKTKNRIIAYVGHPFRLMLTQYLVQFEDGQCSACALRNDPDSDFYYGRGDKEGHPPSTRFVN